MTNADKIFKKMRRVYCPFCGSDSNLEYNKAYRTYKVFCPECGATFGKRFKTEKEAAMAWNRRVGNLYRQCDTCKHYDKGICQRKYLSLKALGSTPCPLHEKERNFEDKVADKQMTMFEKGDIH